MSDITTRRLKRIRKSRNFLRRFFKYKHNDSWEHITGAGVLELARGLRHELTFYSLSFARRHRNNR